MAEEARLSVRIPRELKRQLDAALSLNGQTLKFFVKEAITEALHADAKRRKLAPNAAKKRGVKR